MATLIIVIQNNFSLITIDFYTLFILIEYLNIKEYNSISTVVVNSAKC